MLISQVKNKFYAFFYLFYLFAGSVLAAQPHELIIISGGPALRYFEKDKAVSHDKYWGNFIHAALLRYRELKANLQPGDFITWLVYRPSYKSRSVEAQIDLPDDIAREASKEGIKLFWFDNANQLINYFNFGQDRKQVLISSFDYFGHSNRACFLFDYSNTVDGLSIDYLHVQALSQINPHIFTRDAVVRSWGCHSGELFTKEWKKHFGVPMIGAVGKTDYSNGGLPFISTKDGHWNE